MGKRRKVVGKAKKKRRRRRQEYARTHDESGKYSLHTPLRQDREPGRTVFLVDEPEMSAEELRLRAIERAKEARGKGGG